MTARAAHVATAADEIARARTADDAAAIVTRFARMNPRAEGGPRAADLNALHDALTEDIENTPAGMPFALSMRLAASRQIRRIIFDEAAR